jgi:peptidoglycan lytic transglycosylase D
MTFLPRLLAISAASALVACGAHVQPSLPASSAGLPVATFSGPSGPAVPITLDAAYVVIAAAEADFTAGQAELAQGHLIAAREHFDQAVDRLLGLPNGARGGPAVQTEFESLLDRISALDLIALREGDGQTENQSEPAAIDDLLTTAMFERPQPAATTEETVRADLQRTPHDLEIPINTRVLSYVELFQGRLHEFMASGLQRGLQYLPMIQRVFASEGLPADLAYVPLVESAFKPNALSRVSARGMWQFMLGTAREHGLEQDWFLDERSDPEKATQAAADYLKSLGNMFDGDWLMALASYNAGPGRLQRAVRQSKQADFWKLSATSRYLPRETREYVPMILAAMIIAKNPSLYGFDVLPADPMAWETVSVPGAIDLRIIAEWAGVSVDQIRALNPELRRTTTPMEAHDLKVPRGTAATVEARLATADPSLFSKFKFHTVRRGETLSAIARRYGVKTAELKQANELTSTRVRTNQTLMIPQHTAAGLPSASSSRPDATATAELLYRVRRGDTLYGIARQFDTTVAVLKRLNQLSSDRIIVGDQLTVRR